MRFLTLNLWHGLSPATPVAFEALEPVERRRLREQLQIQTLTDLKPDVVFLQEVNPVLKRAPRLAKALSAQMVFQPDLVGLKLFGLGLPMNLNSGLVILAKPSFGLKKIKGVSLSRPGSHWVQSWGSWQVQEERFALFSEAMLPKWGRVLLVNTHLHHGLEPTPAFLQQLDDLAHELNLDPNVVGEIHRRLEKGSSRRAQELQIIINTLGDLERRYEVVVMGGDFNASPESDFGHALKGMGFRDTWTEAHPPGSKDSGYTYDGTRNLANHRLQERFPLTLVVEDLSFSVKTKEALLRLARQQESRPRRIDYVWLRTQSLPLKVVQSQIVGLPNAEGLAPSDHFGVCSDLEFG